MQSPVDLKKGTPKIKELDKERRSRLAARRKTGIPKAPKKGLEWNPMLKYPRNDRCPCKSGKKFKKCCFPTMKQLLPWRDALEVQEHLDRYLASKPA